MKPPFYFSLLIFSFIISSCSNAPLEIEEEKMEKETVIEAAPTWKYRFNPDATTVKWTAFKHSKKVPVNGKFDSIVVSNFIPSSNVAESLTGLTFELFTSSTNTNDKARDWKIITHFFGNLINYSSIKGEIISANGEQQGNGTVLLDLNGVKKENAFSWNIDAKDEVFMKAEIDVLNWGGKNALDSLNKVCEAKHTGPDDLESILWPNVEIIVLSTLEKE